MWTSRESFFTDAAVFILGASGAYSVNLVGALPVGEVLLFPMLPVLLLSRGKRVFDRQYLWFHILTAAWLLGTLIADIYAGSPPSSRMKGVARVVFFALDFWALAILINNKTRRLIIFALSIVFVMITGARQFQGEFLTEWKFGISSSVIILALLGSSYYYAKKKYWACTGILVALAALNLAFAYRSQIVIILVSAALSMPIFPRQAARHRGRGFLSSRSFEVVVLLTLAGGAAFLANQAIKLAADLGLFEENVSEKFHSQSGGKLGVLFGGRPETLVAIQAIRDSPIVGHGSFPYSPKYMQMKQDIQYEYGYSDSDKAEEVEYPVIPTHSHLTMAWVESGILGGVLWIYILVLTMRAILRMSFQRPSLSPLYAYLLANFLWDILYSPFGSVNRMWGAYLVLISYSLLKTPATEMLSAARRPLYTRQAIGKNYLAYR